MLNTNILGLITNVMNNYIDGVFFVLFILKAIELDKFGKKVVCSFYFCIRPIFLCIVYIFQEYTVVMETTYQILTLLSMLIIPIIVAKKHILKYFICYMLNDMMIMLIGFSILTIIYAVTQSNEMYLFVEDISKLPVCVCSNLIYIAVSYAAYRLLLIIIKVYNPESKFQNAFGIVYFILNNIFSTVLLYTNRNIKSEWRIMLSMMFAVVIIMSFEVVFIMLYQNKQIIADTKILQRHREKELEYYKKLEENQISIRKMRHDINNYFNTIEHLSNNKKEAEKMLKELYERVNKMQD